MSDGITNGYYADSDSILYVTKTGKVYLVRDPDSPEPLWSRDYDIFGDDAENSGGVAPRGVYDEGLNFGWAGAGVDQETVEFAAGTLRLWWRTTGIRAYPRATKLLVAADGGGLNGSRCRLWREGLQRLAVGIGLRVPVCHLPTGTVKVGRDRSPDVLPAHRGPSGPPAGEA